MQFVLATDQIQSVINTKPLLYIQLQQYLKVSYIACPNCFVIWAIWPDHRCTVFINKGSTYNNLIPDVMYL